MTFFHRKLLLKHDGRGKVKHGVGNFFERRRRNLFFIFSPGRRGHGTALEVILAKVSANFYSDFTLLIC